MRVLALDTTTRTGSAAVVVDDRVLAEQSGDAARTHAERLPADLLALLAACDLGLADVDAFAVASGPGSFTGLRIGIATIQGLAFVGRRPVAAVPALDALAHTAAAAAAPNVVVAAWMDASRGEVFSSVYRVTDRAPFDPARLTILEEPRVATPDATLARWMQDRIAPDVVVGDGAVRFAEAIGHAGRACVREPPPLAGTIGRLAVARIRAGEGIDPAAIRPLYVRRPDAELAREARR